MDNESTEELLYTAAILCILQKKKLTFTFVY